MWRKITGKLISGLLVAAILVCGPSFAVRAEVNLTAPSAILIEASTGEVIYEKNSAERRSPASITKIMTLLLTFEQLDAGKIKLEDEVLVSAHAAGMGGSQVFLAEGEIQTLETMIKCIVVSSGNDACVAVAEHIAGSEDAFVEKMNKRAGELGMADTHFVDSCGLTDSDDHYSTARDVAVMSRELITKHPQIYQYTSIWMEDITHVTKQGASTFTLSSTNKLLKQYPYTTGLKTGSTSKARFCVSATANKDGLDMIAVIMGADTGQGRFQDAQVLLQYGFSVCDLYVDENQDALPQISVHGGITRNIPVTYEGEFRYLDTNGNQLGQVEKRIELPEVLEAPLQAGEQIGKAQYFLDGNEIGSVAILAAEDVAKAGYRDCLKRVVGFFLV
ncbi:MAG: D-alanyl-D-alanine carboxypeptidase [Lachnospiraceae bacterium]|nr:D-alanyl-D-alanine carboxypeptidase [Lachnospiraceae bacterium]